MRVFTWDLGDGDYYTNVGFVVIGDDDSLDDIETLIKQECSWLTVDTKRMNVSDSQNTAHLSEITWPEVTIVSHSG